MIIAKPVLTDDEAAKLAGEFLDERHYNTLIDYNTEVLKEDGTPLLVFRRKAIRDIDVRSAFKVLRNAATPSHNRGIAAGKPELHDHLDRKMVAASGQARYKTIKKDGTVSKNIYAQKVDSGIVGAFDRSARLPFCRLTAFTTENWNQLKQALPFIQKVNQVFKDNLPDRYAAQEKEARRTHTDYLFRDTVFTTITVNRNWRTATHQDVGDLKAGFGVLSVLSEGNYDGGYFVVPKYGIAVNMRHGDVMLVDVHEWHGNTELIGKSKYWTRLSTVFYFRSKMVGCQSIKQELEIAKRRKAGTPLYADFNGEFPED